MANWQASSAHVGKPHNSMRGKAQAHNHAGTMPALCCPPAWCRPRVQRPPKGITTKRAPNTEHAPPTLVCRQTSTTWLNLMTRVMHSPLLTTPLPKKQVLGMQLGIATLRRACFHGRRDQTTPGKHRPPEVTNSHWVSKGARYVLLVGGCSMRACAVTYTS